MCPSAMLLVCAITQVVLHDIVGNRPRIIRLDQVNGMSFSVSSVIFAQELQDSTIELVSQNLGYFWCLNIVIH